MPFKITTAKKKTNQPSLIHLRRQNVHAQALCENNCLTEGWMEFYVQIDAKINELLFFFSVAELNYEVISCAENGSDKEICRIQEWFFVHMNLRQHFLFDYFSSRNSFALFLYPNICILYSFCTKLFPALYSSFINLLLCTVPYPSFTLLP